VLSCRTLLFTDTASLANPVETVHLPPLIVLHHILVLSPLRLPHEVHGWSEAEYALWVQKHRDEKEQWALVENAVNGQIGAEGESEGEDAKFVKLVREVLVHARHEDQSPAVV
jgi:hypothetical protein